MPYILLLMMMMQVMSSFSTLWKHISLQNLGWLLKQSGMMKPTTNLCYSVLSTSICNCRTSDSLLCAIYHCQSQKAAVLCLQELSEDLI
jgi:hypothetical protein